MFRWTMGALVAVTLLAAVWGCGGGDRNPHDGVFRRGNGAEPQDSEWAHVRTRLKMPNPCKPTDSEPPSCAKVSQLPRTTIDSEQGFCGGYTYAIPTQ